MHFEKAIELQPGAGMMWALAVLYQQNGQSERGRAVILQCLQSTPQRMSPNSSDLGSLACCYSLLGDRTKYAEQEAKILKQGPASAWQLHDLGEYHILLGDIDEGVEMLIQALKAGCPRYGAYCFQCCWESEGVQAMVRAPRYAELLRLNDQIDARLRAKYVAPQEKTKPRT
jgi:tetratricopeptide (TPR) repeat protein